MVRQVEEQIDEKIDEKFGEKILMGGYKINGQKE